MSAMPTGFSCTKGYVTGKMVSYYARRAKGGVSLIVVEGAAVEDRGRIYSSQLMASDDTYLSGLNELAEGIKKSGAFAVLQLQHGGSDLLWVQIQCLPQMFLLRVHVPGEI